MGFVQTTNTYLIDIAAFCAVWKLWRRDTGDSYGTYVYKLGFSSVLIDRLYEYNLVFSFLIFFLICSCF